MTDDDKLHICASALLQGQEPGTTGVSAPGPACPGTCHHRALIIAAHSNRLARVERSGSRGSNEETGASVLMEPHGHLQGRRLRASLTRTEQPNFELDNHYQLELQTPPRRGSLPFALLLIRNILQKTFFFLIKKNASMCAPLPCKVGELLPTAETMAGCGAEGQVQAGGQPAEPGEQRTRGCCLVCGLVLLGESGRA